MRLDWFVLADAAHVADGKYYIHGGGITRITAARLPWVHPQLALTARVLLEPDNVGHHVLLLEVLGPDDEKVTEANLGFVVEPPTDVLEGEPFTAHLAVTLAHLVLVREGTHRIAVAIDGERCWEEPFVVKCEPPTTPPSAGVTGQSHGH